MGFHNRGTYWSHTKLAKLIRRLGGLPATPGASTSREWTDYHRESKRINKFVNWLSDDALNGLQKFVNWPLDIAHDFTYWVNTRFVDKNHMLSTGLKPGEYHDSDTRILHGLFNTLVVFVTEEKAWMSYICDPKQKDIHCGCELCELEKIRDND